GLIFTLAAIGLLFFIPETLSEIHFSYFFLSMILLGVGEVFISPVLSTVLTQYSDPKYLAIIMSISYLPSRFLIGSVAIFSSELHERPILALTASIIGMGMLAILLFFWNKKYTPHILKTDS
ncbi:MAG: hypothetical protein ACPGD5_09800, partial [Salibacteraceae bacterium]